MRDQSKNEVGGFGITETGDEMLVTDFILVKQTVSCASVEFDDESVADFFEDMVDEELSPNQFARIWIHTHPVGVHTPSCTDEETFANVFGRCDWAIMFILAKDDATYCRLRFNSGPGGHLNVPVQIDFSEPFGQSQEYAWKEEYKDNVSEPPKKVWAKPTKVFSPVDNQGMAIGGYQEYLPYNQDLPVDLESDIMFDLENMGLLERILFVEGLTEKLVEWNAEYANLGDIAI